MPRKVDHVSNRENHVKRGMIFRIERLEKRYRYSMRVCISRLRHVSMRENASGFLCSFPMQDSKTGFSRGFPNLTANSTERGSRENQRIHYVQKINTILHISAPCHTSSWGIVLTGFLMCCNALLVLFEYRSLALFHRRRLTTIQVG